MGGSCDRAVRDQRCMRTYEGKGDRDGRVMEWELDRE